MAHHRHPHGPERRFLDGKVKTWVLHCSRCSCTKPIGTNKARPLPPNIVVKKATQSGWYVDSDPRKDLCPDCRRKPIQTALPLARKALTEAAAPMVADGRMHFSEMMAVARTLGPDEAKQLIEVLRERIPPKPRVERRPKPEPKSNDPEYEQWLNQQ